MARRVPQDAAGSQPVAPPAGVVERAALPDFAALLARADADPEAFWAAHAATLEWSTPWRAVAAGDGARRRWFVGGRTNLTVNCFDRHIAAGHGGRPALTWLGEDGAERRFTYAECLAAVNRIANLLRDLGVGVGEPVILYQPLTPEGVFSLLACARIGAISSAVYAGIGSGALRARIVDCGARVVLYSDVTYRRGQTVALAPIVAQAIEGLAGVRAAVGLRRTAAPLPAGHLDFAALAAAASERCAPVVVDAEHPVLLLYTSGTTGAPKGVIHATGGYMVAVDFYARNFFEMAPGRTWWSTSDIGWIVGHGYIAHGPFLAGAHQIVREGAPDHPDPGIVWRLVDQHQVRGMFTAPTLIRMAMRAGPGALAGTGRRSLELLACAGEPASAEVVNWALRHIVGDGEGHGDGAAWGHVVDNFWQTEVASPLILTWPAMAARPGYAGLPAPGVRVAIVDADGAPVAAGAPGSLIVTRPPPYFLRMVWNDEARFLGLWSDRLGGYVTGDLALRDADGYIRLLGRSDDILTPAGHRLGTAEVEASLIGHPAVAECAVIGLPDPVKGEAIKAYVICRSGITADEALRRALVRHVRDDLGPIAQPSLLDFVAALPKTRSGKIMRRLLRARELGLPEGDLSTLDG